MYRFNLVTETSIAHNITYKNQGLPAQFCINFLTSNKMLLSWIIIGCTLHHLASCQYSGVQAYHSNKDIFNEILELARQYPFIAKPFSIGYSTQGVELVGIRISENVRKKRKILKPMVRLVGNIHGNEVVGREILLHLARYLLEGYYLACINYFVV